jgi:carbon storage regulator
MLILRRRSGEAIVIGEDIEITILDVTGTRVKLGVVAPTTVKVQRKEVRQSAVQNQDAALSPVDATLRELAQQLRRDDA